MEFRSATRLKLSVVADRPFPRLDSISDSQTIVPTGRSVVIRLKHTHSANMLNLARAAAPLRASPLVSASLRQPMQVRFRHHELNVVGK